MVGGVLLLRVLLDERVPLNGGCFRNIEVITRPGSVVHALYPAAVVRAIPRRASGSSMSFLAHWPSVAGKNSRRQLRHHEQCRPRRRRMDYYETIGGGSGASPEFDGASCVQCHMTNT